MHSMRKLASIIWNVFFWQKNRAAGRQTSHCLLNYWTRSCIIRRTKIALNNGNMTVCFPFAHQRTRSFKGYLQPFSPHSSLMTQDYMLRAHSLFMLYVRCSEIFRRCSHSIDKNLRLRIKDRLTFNSVCMEISECIFIERSALLVMIFLHRYQSLYH